MTRTTRVRSATGCQTTYRLIQRRNANDLATSNQPLNAATWRIRRGPLQSAMTQRQNLPSSRRAISSHTLSLTSLVLTYVNSVHRSLLAGGLQARTEDSTWIWYHCLSWYQTA